MTSLSTSQPQPAALPAGASAAPASGDGQALDRLWQDLLPDQRRLLEEVLAGSTLRFLVRSDTKVDVGQWLSSARVILACCDDRLILAAAGKRPFLQQAPLSDLARSFYNHITGELVLAPAPRLSPSSLKLPPLLARQLLLRIRPEVQEHA